jgi:hypothetical protein
MQKKLVESINDVLENMRAFNKGLEENKPIRDQLPFFRQWYYIPVLDMVGPSKFVGYKGMTVSEYMRDRVGMDGKNTDYALREFFGEVYLRSGEGRPEAKYVRDLVKQLLERYDKSINQAARFNVPLDWWIKERGATVPQTDDGRVAVAGESRPVVEVFWRAFQTLYTDDQAALAQRIEDHLKRR